MSEVTSTNALAKDSTLQDVADAIETMSATSVGNMAALQTTDKTSLVGAVNELKSGLTNLTHWINEGLSQESITVTEGYEQLKLYATNASGGTVWAEITILGEFLPSALVLGTMTITRSGSTFTVTANPDNLYIKILSLHA